MSTRCNYINVNGECDGCNRVDYSGYGEGKSHEYSRGLDRRWGKGTAARLYQLSQKVRSWDTKHLEQLTSAAKMGYAVYVQLYDELCDLTQVA